MSIRLYESRDDYTSHPEYNIRDIYNTVRRADQEVEHVCIIVEQAGAQRGRPIRNLTVLCCTRAAHKKPLQISAGRAVWLCGAWTVRNLPTAVRQWLFGARVAGKTGLHLSSFGSRTVSSSTTLMMMMVMMMISCAAAGRGVSLRKSGLCISRYTVDVSLRKPGLCTSRNTAPMELACIVASQMRKCQRTFMIAVEYTHSSSNLNQTAQR